MYIYIVKTNDEAPVLTKELSMTEAMDVFKKNTHPDNIGLPIFKIEFIGEVLK